jgi:hypothetical protein
MIVIPSSAREHPPSGGGASPPQCMPAAFHPDQCIGEVWLKGGRGRLFEVQVAGSSQSAISFRSRRFFEFRGQAAAWGKVCLEACQPGVPARAYLGEPFGCLTQRLGGKRLTHFLTFAPPGDQAGTAEDNQMFDHRLARDGQIALQGSR